MEQSAKIIIPRVLCYSNFREPAIYIPEYIVEVDGFFNKAIVITGFDNSSIRVTNKNKILQNGIEAGKVEFLVQVFDTGKIMSAIFSSDVLDSKLVRNFPKYAARRKYYEVLLNGLKIGYLISGTTADTKIIIRILDGFKIYSWFFGFSAMKIRMSFDY